MMSVNRLSVERRWYSLSEEFLLKVCKDCRSVREYQFVTQRIMAGIQVHLTWIRIQYHVAIGSVDAIDSY